MDLLTKMIQKIKDWILDEPKDKKQFFKAIWSTVKLAFFVNIVVIILTWIFGLKISPRNGTGETNIFEWKFPLEIISSVGIEEFLFRWLPVAITYESGFGVIGKIIVGVLSSGIFGYLHGGISHIFLQGAHGFISYLLFLKTSNMGKNHLKGFSATFLEHLIFNIISILIVIITGGKTI